MKTFRISSYEFLMKPTYKFSFTTHHPQSPITLSSSTIRSFLASNIVLDDLESLSNRPVYLNQLKLLPFPILQARAGSIRGMASAHPPNGVVEDEGKY
jgi:hypothetical protein